MNTNKSPHNIQEKSKFEFTRGHAVLAAVIATAAMISTQCDKKKPPVPQTLLPLTHSIKVNPEDLVRTMVQRDLALRYLTMYREGSRSTTPDRYSITCDDGKVKIEIPGSSAYFIFEENGNVLEIYNIRFGDITAHMNKI